MVIKGTKYHSRRRTSWWGI